jgi:hypothetical protein
MTVSFMNIFLILRFLSTLGSPFLPAEEIEIKKTYQFLDDPIDVVIPSIAKDLATLNLCIEGIKKNCSQIRRIIVVSPEPLTNHAEWFDEKNFPFDKHRLVQHMLNHDELMAQIYLSNPNCFIGWFYQYY